MRSPHPDIIAAAQAADKKWGVFASVSLAQWALESAWGARATGAYNYFGIKGSPSQPSTLCWTHEEEGGHLVACRQLFRDYGSVAQAFDAHARLIATGEPYRTAMLHKGDLASFVRLMAEHYATDPDYAEKLLELIGEEGFFKYDTAA